MAIEWHHHVMLFIMLYKVALTFESVDEILNVWPFKGFLPVVLFIVLYKVVLTFESVDEILKCGHSYDTFLWCCLLCCTRWL